MNGQRETFSLLSAGSLLAACAFWLAGCGGGAPGKPDLPPSVAPGWTLASFAAAPKPDDVVSDPPSGCWKGEYTGPGSAEVWVCVYKVSGSAFDAMQRSRAEAQTVKFQAGNDLVLVRWNNVQKSALEALIRELQKTLH